MPHMKIVLLADVENLGRVGQVVNVRGGHGRNFLIPQGKALPANKANMTLMEQRRKVYEAVAAQARDEAQVIADRIAALSVSVARKVGDNDQLYGSVTTSDIAEALAAKKVVVDKRRLLLAEPIKRLGEYTVSVRLHPDVTAELKVSVVAAE